MSRLELLNKLKNAKLCKVRSRMIRDALKIGAVDRGNIAIIANEVDIRFFYRGVDIALVPIDTLVVHYIPVGLYEHTASTSHQRKAIEEAISEVRLHVERRLALV